VPIKKQRISLDFEQDTIREMRKVLFGKNVSVQYFLSFVLELVSLRDPRIEAIIEEAVENKKLQALDEKTDANSIYQLIERELQKKQNNGAGR
jgi:hypothetical protein